MSDTNGFRVIDVPLASHNNVYGKIVKALLDLPEGKAIEVELSAKGIGNLHTIANRNQLRIKTKTVRAGVMAVWVIARPQIGSVEP